MIIEFYFIYLGLFFEFYLVRFLFVYSEKQNRCCVDQQKYTVASLYIIGNKCYLYRRGVEGICGGQIESYQLFEYFFGVVSQIKVRIFEFSVEIELQFYQSVEFRVLLVIFKDGVLD